MKYNSSIFNLKSLFILTILMSFVGCVNVFKLTDLNVEGIPENNEPVKARMLLTEMGNAHGIESWKDISTYTINFSEEFYGFIGQQQNPFKDELTSLSLSYIPLSSYGQIEILSGRETGFIWGKQDSIGYTIYNDNLKQTVDAAVNHWVPTYQFFIEFPKRIQAVTSISYIGKDTVNGAICEGVLASWNSLKADKDEDQYIIWIDSETKQIAKLEYTLRKISNHTVEAAYFGNYNDYEGLILPSEINVESNLVKTGYLHKMSIYSFNRDYMHKNTLMPIQEEDEDY